MNVRKDINVGSCVPPCWSSLGADTEVDHYESAGENTPCVCVCVNVVHQRIEFRFDLNYSSELEYSCGDDTLTEHGDFRRKERTQHCVYRGRWCVCYPSYSVIRSRLSCLHLTAGQGYARPLASSTDPHWFASICFGCSGSEVFQTSMPSLSCFCWRGKQEFIPPVSQIVAPSPLWVPGHNPGAEKIKKRRNCSICSLFLT